MSVVLGPAVVAQAVLITLVVANHHSLSPEVTLVLACVGGAVASLTYWVSPLPSHNGGWGMPPAKKQQWGFTSEPQAGQSEPDTEEILAWRPSWSGIYWAANQPDGDDDP